MASEMQLQGAELTEVGWGPGAQTGGGPQSRRGQVQRACRSANLALQPDSGLIPRPATCLLRSFGEGRRCTLGSRIRGCGHLPEPSCRPGSVSPSRGHRRARCP